MAAGAANSAAVPSADDIEDEEITVNGKPVEVEPETVDRLFEQEVLLLLLRERLLGLSGERKFGFEGCDGVF